MLKINGRKERPKMPEQVQVPEQTPPPVKITFSPEQQAKVDELIRESMGRAGNEARATAARLEHEMTKLQTELATLKGERTGLESSLTMKDKETQAARNETIAVRKQNVIQDAAAKLGFFNPSQVAQLTDKDVQWDSAK